MEGTDCLKQAIKGKLLGPLLFTTYMAFLYPAYLKLELVSTIWRDHWVNPSIYKQFCKLGTGLEHRPTLRQLLIFVIRKLLEWLIFINPLFTLLEKKIPIERILNPY